MRLSASFLHFQTLFLRFGSTILGVVPSLIWGRLERCLAESTFVSSHVFWTGRTHFLFALCARYPTGLFLWRLSSFGIPFYVGLAAFPTSPARNHGHLCFRINFLGRLVSHVLTRWPLVSLWSPRGNCATPLSVPLLIRSTPAALSSHIARLMSSASLRFGFRCFSYSAFLSVSTSPALTPFVVWFVFKAWCLVIECHKRQWWCWSLVLYFLHHG